jgi:WD40 repeat protein
MPSWIRYQRSLAGAFIFAAGALLLTGSAQAAVPLGGLTVAVSPAGDKLVAGGDTRTLLILDPQTLAVKDRVWIETTIVGLTFDKAGTTLAVEDTSGTVLLYDAATWKKRAELPSRDRVSIAPLAGLVANTTRKSRDTVFIHALGDGKEVAKLTLPKSSNVLGLALSADGKKLAVLLRSRTTKDEPKVSSRDIPKDLKGLARDEFVLKNDGKVSDFFVFDVGSGKPLAQKTTYLSHDSSVTMLFDGDDIVVTNYNNVNAKLAADGAVKLFALQNSYNYGIGIAPDQKLIMTGGLRRFSLTKTDSVAGVTGELPKLPGWPEYFKGFAATTGGGAIYGATTAYRVVKIGSDGKVLAVVPVK